MKIAIAHDYLREYGGAEKVLEVLNEIWHSAPIYTSTFEPEIMEKYRFKVPTGLIHTSFLQYFPFRYPFRKHYFFLYPLAFRSLKIDSDINIRKYIFFQIISFYYLKCLSYLEFFV